ncbi:MAG: hypothetical protein H6842_01125 [Rhodospirillaceae bacterium]|nr:hypothetical protein [Rhodospirillaceae bacterium]
MLIRTPGRLGAAAAIAVLTLTVPAAAQPLERDDLIGTWGLGGRCDSGWGLGLGPDGEAWYDEWGQGLWIVRDGAIAMILQEREMGADTVLDVRPLTIVIESVAHDGFTGRIVEDGQAVTAIRCQ